MEALNCSHCGHRSWYDTHEWGIGDMASPESELRYYGDEKGEREIEACPRCGTLLSREEWEDRPSSDYGIVRLLLLWVLRWGVVEHGQIARSALEKPLARWNEERDCWRVLSKRSDLEDASDFNPMRDFNDVWMVVSMIQREARNDEQVAKCYQRFIEMIDEVWENAVLTSNLGDGFKPWHVCLAILDAFDV
ncbi:MAG TPA: hypothetical protein VFN35_07745 [Ktedonobacteraceae bacterium]|nr:hypothetical protein [Ktedonobacteraceae bacterium]